MTEPFADQTPEQKEPTVSSTEDLNHLNVDQRLEAVKELGSRPALDVPGLIRLEKLAIDDPDAQVRQAALEALQSPAARPVYSTNPLPAAARREILRQIDRWLAAELIRPEQAVVLRMRYDFDARPPAGLPAANQANQSAAQVAPRSPQPAAPRPSLSQVLFSEVSIQIALYLGGFLVIASALILAAIIEIGRLPILLGLTAACGLVSAGLRKRLPLPSFVFFIIFASLLPIAAAVGFDLLSLEGKPLSLAWAVMLAGLSIILGLGSWIYRSRLLSLFVLASTTAAAVFGATFWAERWEIYLFMLVMAGLVTVAWMIFLKARLGDGLVAPLFWLSQAQVSLVLLAVLLTIMVFFTIVLFNTLEPPSTEEVKQADLAFLAAACLGAALFYGITDRWVRRLALLPYLVGVALLLFPWTFLTSLTFNQQLTAAGMAVFGVGFTLAGNWLSLRQRRYGLPLMLVGTGLLAWASVVGLASNTSLGFAILLLSGALFTGLHIQKPRAAAWIVALLAFLAAYLAFFHLPFARNWDIHTTYRLLGAGLLLLLPDLLPLPGEQVDRRWRLPARILGAAVLLANTQYLAFLILIDEPDPSPQLLAARVLAVLAGFFWLYAVRRKVSWVGYLANASLGLSLLCWLVELDRGHYTLPLAGLASGLYLAGLGLRRAGKFPRWASMLRYSGLVIGALAAPLPYEEKYRLWVGLGTLLAGVTFLSEIILQRGGWIEYVMHLLLAAAITLLVDVVYQGAGQTAYTVAGIAVLILALDLIFTRLSVGRSWHRWGARGLGLLAALAASTIVIFTSALAPQYPAQVFAVFAAFALLAAWGYKLPRLGYAAVAFAELSLYFTLRHFHQADWLGPMIGLAAVLYLSSFGLAKLRQESKWVEVLRFGGLGAAMIVAITAPLQGGLPASLWSAIAASLFAIEAFRRRSVWWGFPTNGLYLLAYFILLFELKIDQPQYYSVGVAVVGILMHFLLVRAGSRTGAFITGLVSQFVLLGTTYIQMVSTNQLGYFVMLFFQALVVLAYGILVRSRSLVLAPVVFIIAGVITVVLSVLSGIPTAIIIGCTGLVLLLLGIIAVVLRERLSQAGGKLGERLGGWRA